MRIGGFRGTKCHCLEVFWFLYPLSPPLWAFLGNHLQPRLRERRIHISSDRCSERGLGMAQWIYQVLLPCLPLEGFLPSCSGEAVCTQPSPCPQVAGLHLFRSRQTSEPLLCWSAGLGPGRHHTRARPLSPLSPASCRWLSLPALDTVSTHSPEAELKEKQKELPGSPWLWPAPSYQD